MHLLTRSLPPNQEFLNFGLKLLRLVGLWGDPRMAFRYYLMVAFELTFLIGPKAILGPPEEGFESFARNTAELIFVAEVVISIVIFAMQRKSFEALVDVLERIFKRQWSDELRAEIGQFNRRMELFARIYAIYLATMVIMYIALPILSTIVKMIFVAKEDRSDFMIIISLNFYWLDIRHNIYHYMIYMFFTITTVGCSAFQSSLKISVIVVVIQYGAKLFDLVAKRIVLLREIKSLDERDRELREIIILHNLALEYVEHLETTVCYIMINQIVNCMLISCLMMFYITTTFGVNAVNVLLMFIVLMGEMVVYCINGNILSDKAIAVVDTLYDYPWYEEPVWMQKAIRRIMQRGQRPTGITAAKFYYVNIQRLGVVVQASYSYYLILKNRF